MESESRFTFSGRIRSISDALNGIKIVISTQHNAWIHIVATIVVLVAGCYYRLSSSEWLWLIVAIVLVWVTEILNTAFELLCDVASPEFHPIVKKCKDVAAGAVLVSAAGSIIIGVIIFRPYLF